MAANGRDNAFCIWKFHGNLSITTVQDTSAFSHGRPGVFEPVFGQRTIGCANENNQKLISLLPYSPDITQ